MYDIGDLVRYEDNIGSKLYDPHRKGIGVISKINESIYYGSLYYILEAERAYTHFCVYELTLLSKAKKDV